MLIVLVVDSESFLVPELGCMGCTCVWSRMVWCVDNGSDSIFEQPFYVFAHDPRPSVVPGILALVMAASLAFG